MPKNMGTCEREMNMNFIEKYITMQIIIKNMTQQSQTAVIDKIDIKRFVIKI